MNDPGTPSPDRSPLSCVECRRKKAKCDRSQPCSNCTKLQRPCTYERISRTPLTRKYLSEVEQELARTKALLRSYEGAEPFRSESLPNDHQSRGDAGYDAPQFVDSNNGTFSPHSQQNTPHSMNAFQIGQENSSTSTVLYQENHGSSAVGTRSSNLNKGAEASSVFSLETPPGPGDFDWDERITKNGDARFIDGMASLTERSSRGYMGVASGAALLRLADGSEETANGAENLTQDDTLHNALSVPVMLFSLSQLEPFVAAYFQLYHISYPIIHEATFRAQVMEVIPRPKSNAWEVLLLIVAALGSFTASETAPETDVALFEAAKARLSIDMLETGNVILVQALTLISNYVQKRNKPNSGYNYLGLAKRMAMGIGLHKEFPTWRSKPLMLEMRRRIWWCLYIFDVGATITFSRPLDLPSDGIEVALPLNVHDADITASTKNFPPESQTTTLYTHVRCQSNFHLASSSIYVKLISTPFPTAEEMIKLDDNHISPYKSNLPLWFQEGVDQCPKFRLPHAILSWRLQNFRILMYRPFLMRRFMLRGRTVHDSASEFEEYALQRCLNTAAETVQAITEYWRHEKQNVMACWYSLYFLFQAILIPVICLRNEPHSNLAPGWRDQVLNALEVVSDMTRLNSAASRCHNTITKLCGAYLAQDAGQWESPTHESPQTQLNTLSSFMWPMTDAQLAVGLDFALQEPAMHDFMNQISNL